MSTVSASPTAPPGPPPVTLRSAWRSVWPALHVLITGSAITGIAGMAALGLAGYAALLGIAGTVLCWITFAPLVRWCVRAALGQQPGWREYLAGYRLWRRDMTAAAAMVVPAGCAALGIGWWNAGLGVGWLLSAGAGIAVGVLACYWAAVSAVTDFGSTAAGEAARRTAVLLPRLAVVVTGCGVLGAAGLMAAANWSASVLVLVAGPVAVCLAGGSWETLTNNHNTVEDNRDPSA